MAIRWNGRYLEEADRTWIDKSDLNKLMAAAKPDEMVMLVLGAGMGLRRSEIANLNLRDIDGDRIVIRGKGHNGGKVVTRTMPIYVKEAIDQYIPVRESILSEYGDNSGGNLLVKPTRRIGFPVNPMDISNMVLRLKQRSGVNFTCHSLRRLFATTVNSVADLETLRQLMRHSSIEVTFKCYLNARPEVKNKALDEANEVLFGDPGWIVID